MILTDEGKKEFLKSEFHPYFDIHLNEIDVDDNMTHFVNFVLPVTKIKEFYDDERIDYLFNNDYSNILFTPIIDGNEEYIILNYELYQDVFFIRIKPFSNTIRLHILPKKYSMKNENSILFFKDNKQNIDENIFSCTEEYERKTDKKNINLYYKENTVEISNGFYKFDIKEHTKNINTIQINLGYSYNDTNPSNKIWHTTGIIDESNENGVRIPASEMTGYNSTLIDVNADNNSDYTNKILQQSISNGINWDTPYDCEGGFNNEHSINTLYHKTLKYFNDDLYTEEDGKYHIVDWSER